MAKTINCQKRVSRAPKADRLIGHHKKKFLQNHSLNVYCYTYVNLHGIFLADKSVTWRNF